MLLLVIALTLQALALGLGWLSRRASARTKASLGPLARTPGWLVSTFAMLGLFTAGAWGVAASDTGAFPAPSIQNAQRSLSGKAERKLTTILMIPLAMPLLPFLPFLTADEPRESRKKRKRRKAKREESSLDL